jgi:hypothetical protein
VAGEGTADADADGTPDDCDLCEGDFAGDQLHDEDGDGVADACDNCPITSNSGQENTDGDGLGDACDPSNSTAETLVFFEGFGSPHSLDGWTNPYGTLLLGDDVVSILGDGALRRLDIPTGNTMVIAGLRLEDYIFVEDAAGLTLRDDDDEDTAIKCYIGEDNGFGFGYNLETSDPADSPRGPDAMSRTPPPAIHTTHIVAGFGVDNELGCHFNGERGHTLLTSVAAPGGGFSLWADEAKTSFEWVMVVELDGEVPDLPNLERDDVGDASLPTLITVPTASPVPAALPLYEDVDCFEFVAPADGYVAFSSYKPDGTPCSWDTEHHHMFMLDDMYSYMSGYGHEREACGFVIEDVLNGTTYFACTTSDNDVLASVEVEAAMWPALQGGDTCETAVTLPGANGVGAGQMSDSALDLSDLPGCPGELYGKDSFFKINVPDGQTLTVSETLDVGDEAIVLLTACDAMFCAGGADNSGNDRETASWTNTTGADVEVIVGLEEYCGPEALHYLLEWDVQ